MRRSSILVLLAACGGGAPATVTTPCPAPVATETAPIVIAEHGPLPGAIGEPAPDPTGSINVTVLPAPAYLERSDRAQLVNCDFLVDNQSGVAWELAEIQVSVLDRKGALTWRKLLNGNGISPSITTIPDRVFEARAQSLLFNPLYDFPRELELGTLRYLLTFGRDGSDEQRTATVEVTPTDFRGHARLQLPLAGRVLVWDGHDFLSHHRRWDYVFAPIRAFGFDSNAQRYSLDLVIVNAAGEMLSGDPAQNASWFGFGAPVRAPAAGTVVAVEGSRPDDRTFDQDQLKSDLRVMYGNYVIIDHGSGEFSVLGHVQQGSPTVKVGDRVKAGQQVAAIGASGSSLFPHLHYQLQSRADGHAEGLPAYFHDFARVLGSRTVKVKEAAIDSGDLLEAK